jgi:hypothetical protein
MGANAQTSVPTFTAGEVLTAANMNISARTGIPVFADSTARDAAFGGTGEKTLAEGQFAYLESTNATQYYDGAAWQSVGGASGLVMVTATSTANTGGTVTTSGGRVTVAGSSSVSLNGVFTSTYHNYLILVDTLEQSAAGPNDINLRLRALGTDTTTSTYYAGQIYGTYTGTAGGSNNNGVAQFPIGGLKNAKQQMNKIEVFSPQAATITTIHSLGVAQDAQSNYAGYQNGTTQYDGFTLFMAANNFSCNITVYAYQKS